VVCRTTGQLGGKKKKSSFVSSTRPEERERHEEEIRPKLGTGSLLSFLKGGQFFGVDAEISGEVDGGRVLARNVDET